jgi:hypothetical protein
VRAQIGIRPAYAVTEALNPPLVVPGLGRSRAWSFQGLPGKVAAAVAGGAIAFLLAWEKIMSIMMSQEVSARSGRPLSGRIHLCAT